jgi:hypothetical protein
MKHGRIARVERDGVIVLLQARARLEKIAARPRALDDQFAANAVDVRVHGGESLQERGPHLTEVCPDYHVQFVELALLLLIADYLLNDYHNEQHFEGKKRKVAQPIDRHLIHVAEDEIVNEVEHR